MWLFLVGLIIVIVALVAGLLAGGIFTIIFLPVAVIILGGALVFYMWGRSGDRSRVPGEGEPVRPLPHTQHANTAAPPSSPDQLADSRRQTQ
jgi:hypothetical protein